MSIPILEKLLKMTLLMRIARLKMTNKLQLEMWNVMKVTAMKVENLDLSL